MKIFYTSDTHLDFYIKPNKTNPDKIKKLIKRLFPDLQSSDVLIIAGDLSHYNFMTVMFLKCIKKYFKKIFITTGNHEFYNVSKNQKQKYKSLYSKFNELKELIKPLEDIHFLDGDVIEYNGIKFGGAMGWYDCSYFYKLATVYGASMVEHWKSYSNDGNLIPTLKNPLDLFSIEIQKIKKVLKQKPDIMITHICPVSESIIFSSEYKTNRGSGYYCFDGLDLTEGIKHWFYGHLHDKKEFEIYGCNFHRNPLGYPGDNIDFKLEFIEI